MDAMMIHWNDCRKIKSRVVGKIYGCMHVECVLEQGWYNYQLIENN